MTDYIIESKNNRVVKLIQALKNKKYRDEKGLFIIEGENFISEIKNFEYVEFIAISKNYKNTNFDCKTYILSDNIFKYCSDTKNPQGILAVCKKQTCNIESLISNIGKNGFYVIAEQINDPGNLGTIIRTADAVNVDGLFITSGSVDLYNSKTLRSTMGSIFHINIFQGYSIEYIMKLLIKNGISIYATSLESNKYPYNFDFKKGTAFILGNEARGVSNTAVSMCIDTIKLPMIGKAESLNVSIAAGVLMYEVVRQRIL